MSPLEQPNGRRRPSVRRLPHSVEISLLNGFLNIHAVPYVDIGNFEVVNLHPALLRLQAILKHRSRGEYTPVERSVRRFLVHKEVSTRMTVSAVEVGYVVSRR